MNKKVEVNKNDEIKVFLQTRPTTCGIACLMMIVNFLKFDMPLSSKKEGSLLRFLRMKNTSLVPIMTLAWYAKFKYECDVEVGIELGKVDFWNVFKHMGEDFYNGQLHAYQNAREAKVKINYNPIDTNSFDKLLAEDYLLICTIKYGEDIKHSVVLYGMEEGFYKIIDPLQGKQIVTKKDLLENMRMDVGTFYVAIKR